jgi:hypothetical protein
MNNTRAQYPGEVQFTGKSGDIYFFFLDTWHARSENTSNRFTGIMLPDFVNHSTKLELRFLREASDRIESLRGVLKHALRPFEAEKANVSKSWIDKWIYRSASTEQFFHNLFYSLRTYQGRHIPGGTDSLPPYTTAAVLEQTITVGQCFKHLSPWLLLRRYLILKTLNRYAAGRALRRLVNR